MWRWLEERPRETAALPFVQAVKQWSLFRPQACWDSCEPSQNRQMADMKLEDGGEGEREGEREGSSFSRHFFLHTWNVTLLTDGEFGVKSRDWPRARVTALTAAVFLFWIVISMKYLDYSVSRKWIAIVQETSLNLSFQFLKDSWFIFWETLKNLSVKESGEKLKGPSVGTEIFLRYPAK